MANHAYSIAGINDDGTIDILNPLLTNYSGRVTRDQIAGHFTMTREDFFKYAEEVQITPALPGDGS